MIRCVGVAGVAGWLGISPASLTKYLTRYANTPEPDVEIGEGPGAVKGWLPTREAEWRAWDARRPGRGAGGGPKPKATEHGSADQGID